MARFWSSHFAGVLLLLGTIYALVHAEKSEKPWDLASAMWAVLAGILGGIFVDWMGR